MGDIRKFGHRLMTSKVRRVAITSRGKRYAGYQISVPPVLALLVPADARFACELTDEGILFRLVRDEPPRTPPPWATGRKEGE